MGKKGKGPTPVGALGTTDQHSLLQLFKEGPSDKVVGFVDVTGEAAALSVGQPLFSMPAFDYIARSTFETLSHKASLATQTSLQRAGLPTYRIETPALTPECYGAFFFLYETACAMAGDLYGVDPFDQPGVEETKQLLHAALR